MTPHEAFTQALARFNAQVPVTEQLPSSDPAVIVAWRRFEPIAEQYVDRPEWLTGAVDNALYLIAVCVGGTAKGKLHAHRS